MKNEIRAIIRARDLERNENSHGEKMLAYLQKEMLSD